MPAAVLISSDLSLCAAFYWQETGKKLSEITGGLISTVGAALRGRPFCPTRSSFNCNGRPRRGAPTVDFRWPVQITSTVQLNVVTKSRGIPRVRRSSETGQQDQV